MQYRTITLRRVALACCLWSVLPVAPAGALGPRDQMPLIENTSAIGSKRLDHLAKILHQAYEDDGAAGMEAAINACYVREDEAPKDQKKMVAVECFLLDRAGEVLYDMFVKKMANQGRPVPEPATYFVDQRKIEHRRGYNILAAFAAQEAGLFWSLVGNGPPGVVIRVHNLRARDRVAADAAPFRTIRITETRVDEIADYFWRIFRDHGAIGIEEAISRCYEVVSRAKDRRKLRLASCLALDLTGEELNRGYLEFMASKKLPAESAEFFDERVAIQRRAKYFDSIFTLDELAEWLGDVPDEVVRRISILQKQGSEGVDGGAQPSGGSGKARRD